MDVLISSINYDINSQTCVPPMLIANVKDVGTRTVQVNVYNGALALSLPQGCVVTASMVVDDTLIYGGDGSVPCTYENNTISVPLGTTEKPLGNLSGNLKVQIKIVDGNQTLQFPIAFKVMLTGDCADESITQAQAGYVDTRLIADSSVTTAKLADGSVTRAKLEAAYQTSILRTKGELTRDYGISNVNNVTISGVYHIDGTCTNTPYASAVGELAVINNGNYQNGVVQLFFPHAEGGENQDAYYRERVNNNYYPWKKIVNSSEVYTKSETDAMIPDTYHKTIIDGDQYAWERKNGEGTTTNYCIRSSAISVGKNKEVIFTGNTTLHDTPCYAYVVEYDNSSFIKREQILTNSAIRLDDACKFVRFLYLHASSTHVQMPVESKSSFSAVMQYPIDIPEFVDQTDSRISTLEDDLETIDTALSDMHISRFAGADSSWTNTFISKYGAATSISTSIASDYVELDDNARKLAFTGSIVLSNEACIAYAVQYDENKGFITRSLLYAESTGHLSVVIPKSCKFVRFLYLHSSSTHVQMPLSANESFSILMQADSTGRDRSIPLGLHTMPENEGVLNLIRRCRQLTDIKWTPAVDLPRLLWNDDDYYEGVFKQGVEYTGIPYGRCVTYKSVYGKETTYAGSEIDYSTFVTAVSNPDSMICQESAYSHSDHRSVPYASVCSSLVCHALNVPYVDTSGISGISGLQNKGKIVNNGARMDLKTLKLGDVLNYSSYHTMVITDIITDDDGEVTYIEISEATPAGNDNRSVLDGQLGGLCRRIGYDSEAFYSRCKSYTVYRYLNIASIPYTKSAYVNVGDELDMKPYIHYPCMPYEGEGFIYEPGHIPESKIKLLIDCHDTNGDNIYSHISIFKDGTELSGSPIALSAQQTYVEVMEIGAGEYTAYLSKIVGGSTVKSLSCHWSVREEGGE